jgi:hypothetical protein
MNRIAIRILPLRVEMTTMGGEVVGTFYKLEDWVRFLNDNPGIQAICSSSLDWPWDYEDMTPEIVEVCNAIRGNSVPLTREEDQL